MHVTVSSMRPRTDKIHVVRDNETETWRSDYTDRKAGVPQLLLVEQQIPGSQILPHFHGIDQFQVFMDGEGKLGHHVIKPVSIHYTNKFTGYGPIQAGAQGMSYYVLRPSFDTLGSQYLHVPESRKHLTRGGKRFFLADGIVLRTPAELSALAAQEVQRVIGVDKPDDPEAGLFADIVCLGPNMRYAVADPATGGGQVVLVMAGGIAYRNEALGPRGAIAITHDEPALAFVAGAEGAQLMVLQYPRRAEAWT